MRECCLSEIIKTKRQLEGGAISLNFQKKIDQRIRRQNLKMNFTSPIKSSGGHNNIFDSPAGGFMSPNIYDCSNEKGVRAINMIHTPFTCG